MPSKVGLFNNFMSAQSPEKEIPLGANSRKEAVKKQGSAKTKTP